MRIYQSLTGVSAENLVEVAVFLENQTLFDGAFMGNHWIYPRVISDRYPHTRDGKPRFAPTSSWPHIAAAFGVLAGVTRRLHFTSSVLVLPLYHPIEVAKMFATLSTLSGGRVELGVGVGWMRAEYDAAGVDFGTRGDRCDEMLEVIRQAWTCEILEFQGRYFEIAPSIVDAHPVHPVPIYVAGASKAAMRRAARAGDGWLGTDSPEDTFESIRDMKRMLGESDRDSERFEVIVPARADVELLKRFHDAGVTTVHNLFALDVGPSTPLCSKLDAIRRYSDEVIDRFRR